MNEKYHITIDLTEKEKWKLKQLAAEQEKSVRKFVKELIITKIKE